MTWHGEIKTTSLIIPSGGDWIEQVTTKNFNQSAYLDKADRENTFWLLQEGTFLEG